MGYTWKDEKGHDLVEHQTFKTQLLIQTEQQDYIIPTGFCWFKYDNEIYFSTSFQVTSPHEGFYAAKSLIQYSQFIVRVDEVSSHYPSLQLDFHGAGTESSEEASRRTAYREELRLTGDLT